jgi:hypothetical protein
MAENLKNIFYFAMILTFAFNTQAGFVVCKDSKNISIKPSVHHQDCRHTHEEAALGFEFFTSPSEHAMFPSELSIKYRKISPEK